MASATSTTGAIPLRVAFGATARIAAAFALCGPFLGAPRCASQDVAVDGPDGPSLCKVVAAQHRANWEWVRTWQGDAELEELALIAPRPAPVFPRLTPEEEEVVRALFEDGPVLLKQTVAVSFAVDAERDALFSSYRRSGDVVYINRDTGRAVRATPAVDHDRRAVITPEHFLHLDEEVRHGPNHELYQELPTSPGGNRHVYRDAKDVGQQSTLASDVFDPRRVVDCLGRPIPELLDIVSRFHEQGQFNLVVTKLTDSDGYRMRWSNRNNDQHEIDFVRRGSALLVERAELVPGGGGGGGRFQTSWRHIDEDGVFVPVEWTNQHVDDMGRIRHRRTVRFQTHRLNEVIPAETFSFAVFPLEDGDRVIDALEGAINVFHQGDLIGADRYRELHASARSPETSVPSTSRGARVFLLVCNLVAVIGVAGVALVRWRARSHR